MLYVFVLAFSFLGFANEEGHHQHHPAKASSTATEFGDVSKLGSNSLALDKLVKDYETHKTQMVATTGTVKKVCEKMGCWFVLEDGSTQVRVLMKDNGFSVPANMVGKKVKMVGNIQQKELPVKVLRHYLKDEGKTDKEVEKITQPQTVFMFEAIGVKLI